MSEGMTGAYEVECMDAVEAKEASEANLVPRGRWKGELQLREGGLPSILKTITTEAGDHPLEGKEIHQCHVKLETEEGTKHLFFDAYPLLVRATSKAGGSYKRVESVNASYLIGATKLYTAPLARC